MNAIEHEEKSPDVERYVVRNNYWGGADGRGTRALFAVDLPSKKNWYEKAKAGQNAKR